MKKIISFFLTVLFLLNFTMPTFASGNVTFSSPKIGSSTANLVIVQMGEKRTIDVALGSSKLHTDVSANTLINEPAKDNNSSIVASINGGFFNSYYKGAISYPNNYPKLYSSIIKDGYVLNGGGEDNYFGITWDGVPYIDRTSFKTEIYTNSATISPWAVGSYNSDSRAISLLSDKFPYTVTVVNGGTAFVLKNNKIISEAKPGNYVVPTGTSLLVYNSDAVSEATMWNTLPKVSDDAVISFTCANSNWNNTKTAVSGGRMLLKDSVDVTSSNTYNSQFNGDAKQSATGVAQRSFIAITKDKKVILGTANASLSQIAQYLKSIGVVDALSLDGGASSMLYEKGKGFITSAGRKLDSALVIVDEKTTEQKTTTTSPIKNVIKSVSNDNNTPSPWAQEIITQCKDINLIPDWLQYDYRKNITRREFCVEIVSLIEVRTGMSIDEFRQEENIEYVDGFYDSDDYYVRECASLGIVNGSNGYFRPNDTISRQEAASILQRTAEVLGIKQSYKYTSFSDESQISSWAKPSVSFVTSTGIMNGTGTSFKPYDMLTREQAYITMFNILIK